ncbi:toxin ParE1/3/4 [Inquilinus ginsengisoli]|uniref:Toxin ParE1/3/4 n=1 Tax=Inquilinus ginsengisoli TaxID=363840 RepID=A0ABU1JWT2_9PROT|nr:type II toxin-antitoxin system RelE/ParE family toxin [Inquilinus ginsengisoli]MDR6293079.1 toxin ParE1/3/4 [Inquilinus ginsengisoli]
MRVDWRPAAREDLLDIADHIDIDNPVAAVAILDVIELQVAMLAEHPRMGGPGRLRNTRELVVNHTPYVVAYRIDESAVTILRVMHGARKWPRRL